MRCPRCDRCQIGRIANAQWFCWNCYLEFHRGLDGWTFYELDEEGALVAVSLPDAESALSGEAGLAAVVAPAAMR